MQVPGEFHSGYLYIQQHIFNHSSNLISLDRKKQQIVKPIREANGFVIRCYFDRAYSPDTGIVDAFNTFFGNLLKTTTTLLWTVLRETYVRLRASTSCKFHFYQTFMYITDYLTSCLHILFAVLSRIQFRIYVLSWTIMILQTTMTVP